MSWRFNLKPYIINGPIYEFGIFTGQSIVDISKIYKDPIECFGFDSFIGLPHETKDIIGQECWTEGNFSSKDHFHTSNIEDTIDKVREFILTNGNIKRLELIPGF